jgi:hypothetical protein
MEVQGQRKNDIPTDPDERRDLAEEIKRELSWDDDEVKIGGKK